MIAKKKRKRKYATLDDPDRPFGGRKLREITLSKRQWWLVSGYCKRHGGADGYLKKCFYRKYLWAIECGMSDDAIHDSCIRALMQAAEKYKVGYEATFTTYANVAIKKRIRDDIRKASRRKRWMPTITGSAAIVKLKSGKQVDLINMIASKPLEPVTENQSDAVGMVSSLLAHLSEKDAKIIAIRYGLKGEPLSQEKTAKQVGCNSRSRISQIEIKALARLRKIAELGLYGPVDQYR